MTFAPTVADALLQGIRFECTTCFLYYTPAFACRVRPARTVPITARSTVVLALLRCYVWGIAGEIHVDGCSGPNVGTVLGRACGNCHALYYSSDYT